MRALSILPSLGALVAAQEFVPTPRDLELVPSKLFKGAEISYKKTAICETTEGVNSYSGYVTLPKDLLPDAKNWTDEQSAHLFFWYFGKTPGSLSPSSLTNHPLESRKDPSNAPTSIYLGGGPGTSSFDSMSNFPCFVNPDGNSTTLNEVSWNNNVNMLYIDQPLGTGFSYVTLVNGTLDVLTHTFTPVDGDEVPEVNVTTLQATFDARAEETVPRTTMSAVRTLWVFVQVWFNEFPGWITKNDEISLWASSFGGFYGPHFFSYVQDQNDRINRGRPLIENATTLNLATLGLDEPAIDVRAMAKGYPLFGHNNTYGIEIFDKETYEELVALIEAPDEGCYALVDQCRGLVAEGDPERYGNNQTVNEACVLATKVCFGDVQGAYGAISDRSPFDVTHSNITMYPWSYMDNFLNQAWVQEELGVPLNFTSDWGLITQVFLGETGDPMVGSLTTLEKVIEGGVNVALAYGDRDYRCPWYGGENASLSMDFPSSSSFRSAGYAPIITNASYTGGFVREHGNLSFSRIFQSGHGVAAYQPETLSVLFERAIFRKDVATGEVDLSQNSSYSTSGPRSVADVKNEVLEAPENMCLVRLAPLSCTGEQLEALADGTAVVEGCVVVEPRGRKPNEIGDGNETSLIDEASIRLHISENQISQKHSSQFYHCVSTAVQLNTPTSIKLGMEIIRQVLDPWSARSIASRAGYCDVCSRMLGTHDGIKALCTLPGYRHYNELECRRSAKRGCPLCEMILQQGWEGDSDRQGRPLYFISRKPKGLKPPKYSPEIVQDRRNMMSKGFGDMAWLDAGWIGQRGSGPRAQLSWETVASFVIMASYDDPAGKYFPERTICDSFLDDQIMEEAIKWLQDCIEGRHETCVYLGKPRLPTRVLDVDPSYGSTVRLRPIDAKDRDNYVALSYCWGGPQPLTTTKSNIADLMAGIQVSDLPQTLQDAVHVTRRLGIRYLWIDALCIIQDSDEDKFNEIDKMGAIYRNALVTLAAAHARAASDGFLIPSTDHKPSSSCTLPVCLPSHPKIGFVTLAAELLGWRDTTEPLRTRGWAYQEAILSQRLLTFSKHDLQCHCKLEHQRLLNPGSLSRNWEPTLYPFAEGNFEMLESRRKEQGDGWMDAKYLNSMWEAMLAEFTLRSLTVADDRPRALRGIANEVLESGHLGVGVGRGYVAGTWMACLPAQLLWGRTRIGLLSPDGGAGSAPVMKTRSKRAPSWSWVGLDCPVGFKSIESGQSYEGFSVIRTPSQTGEAVLEVECNVVCRSRDDFNHDRSKAKDIRLNMDLDVEELDPRATHVYYLLFARYIRRYHIRGDDPPMLRYVSGIVAHETADGCFGRLGYLRWNVHKPATDEFPFGQRRIVKLV
ncbi:hypothetical protein ACJ41O_003727 [Fusarium nematophilum]